MPGDAAGRTSRLSLSVALTFAAITWPVQAVLIAVAVHLPAHFAASIGVELTVVAAAFAVVRFIDIPIEPALGIAMDRTRSPIGRYRLWAMLGAPLLMLGLYMLLIAREGVGQSYLIGWLIVMYLGLSTITLAQQAWAATLAGSYEDRARLFGVMGSVGVAGALSVLMVPIILGSRGYSEAEGVRAMIWYLIAVVPFAIALGVWRTPERVMREHGQRFRLRDYGELVTDPSMARILLADLALSFGPGWMAALYIFYSRDSMGFTAAQGNAMLAVYIVSGVVGAPAMAWLATKISKHRSVMVASVGYALLLVALAFVPHGSLMGALPILFFTGFFSAGFNVLTRAMTADVADEVRLKQGKERSGLLYAMTTLTTKFASGAAIFVTYNVLDQVGYDPQIGQANTPAALRALELAFLSGPIVFVMLGAACLIGYRLTAERAAEVRRQLEARETLNDPAASLEGLTGEEFAPPEPSR